MLKLKLSIVYESHPYNNDPDWHHFSETSRAGQESVLQMISAAVRLLCNAVELAN
jgi:hypothetical protein